MTDEEFRIAIQIPPALREAGNRLRRRAKLHIRGPFVGGLYLAYSKSKPGLSATGLTPEMAWNAWMSYQGIKP